MKKAVYPGTFDPVTCGHLDIMTRAGALCDHLIIAVAENPAKKPFFSLKERCAFLEQSLKSQNIAYSIRSFSGLLVDFVRENQAGAIIRGLRAVSDFDYEFQLTGLNRRLDPTLETIFLMAKTEYLYISSGIVKEIIRLKGQTIGLIPESIAQEVTRKLLAP